MSRNNDVFKVLVTKGDSAVLGAGATIDTLAPGQIGVFDEETKLSIDGTTVVRHFFIAVGVDRDGDTVVDDINKSSGQLIQRANMRFYSFRPHTAAQPMIAELVNYVADCDTDYAFKLEFRNQEIYRIQGFNQFSKTYTFRTSCCEDCADCPSGDANEITTLLVNEINNDASGLAFAEAIARQAITIATHGTSANYAIGDVVSLADVAILIAYNAGEADPLLHVFTDTRITTVPVAINKYCDINVSYFKPRQTIIIPSLVEGFGCNGTVSITQEAAMEEGNGYDIKQKEYHSSGWGKSGPYKASTATGLAISGLEYFADETVKYDQFALTYDQFSIAGWLEHLNNLATIIAVPETDTTTADSLVAVLDGLLTPLGFDALADDVALANVNPAVVEPTTDIDDPDGDGIA